MRIEDPFDFDPVRESQFVSRVLGYEVEFVADVTGETESPYPTLVIGPTYSAYPDDRDPSVSVRPLYCGLPSLGRRR